MKHFDKLIWFVLGVLAVVGLYFAAGLEPPGKHCFREHWVRNHVTNQDMKLLEPVDCRCAFRYVDPTGLEICR